MDKKRITTTDLTNAALVAAIYVVLTFVSQAFGLASGAIQFRLSEALTILPVFTAVAIPGLTVGCLLANLLTGCALWDIVFGTLATLIGAIGTHYIARINPKLGVIPPIVANMLIVPAVLMKVYGADGTYWYLMFTVGVGEVVCAGVLGLLVIELFRKRIAPLIKK